MGCYLSLQTSVSSGPHALLRAPSREVAATIRCVFTVLEYSH